MDKILKNNTANAVEISDIGLEVPASGQITIEETDYLILAASVDTPSLITAGTITVNDGTNDLSTSDGINFLKFGEDVSFWNANKIKGVVVDDTNKANNKILKYNSATGKLEYQDDLTSATVFGTEYNYFESDSTSSTTSKSYQNKINSTTTSLTGGDYLILASWEYTNSSSNIGTYAKVIIDGISIHESVTTKLIQDGDWMNGAVTKKMTLTSGTKTVQIQFKNAEDATAKIRNARLHIWRIS